MRVGVFGSFVVILSLVFSCQNEQEPIKSERNFQEDLARAEVQIDSLKLVTKDYERLLDGMIFYQHGEIKKADSLWDILEHGGDERLTILISRLQEEAELRELAKRRPEKEIVVIEKPVPQSKSPIRTAKDDSREGIDPTTPIPLHKEEKVSSLTFISTKNVLIEYKGQIRNGKANGEGVGRFESGSIYEGEWRDNMRHGTGTFTWEDGASYSGEFENGVRQGQGSYHFTNGDVYVGDWYNDRRHGEGIYKNKQGKILYQGQWENDEFIK